MTWIFWRKVFREGWAMFVCSVFFLFSKLHFHFCVFRVVMLGSSFAMSSTPRVMFCFLLMLLYFCIRQHDVNILMQSFFREEDRCLCAPFFYFIIFIHDVIIKSNFQTNVSDRPSQITCFVRLELSVAIIA